MFGSVFPGPFVRRMIEKKGSQGCSLQALCEGGRGGGGAEISVKAFLLDYSEKGTTDHFRERSPTEN